MKKIYAILALCVLLGTALMAQPVNGTTTFFTSTTTPLQPNTACVVTKTTTLSGWLFSIQTTSNCGFNWTSTTGGDGRIQYLAGFGTVTQLTFGADDGSEFALNNLVWGVSTSSWVSKPMTFVGYKNGVAVPGATLNATTPAGTGITNTTVVTFTNNVAFNDVDNITLAPNSTTCNTILFFEEITVGTATPACISPTLTVNATNVLCNGGSTGSATLSASGGTTFTYSWLPSGGTGTVASGLSAGNYTVSATNNCGSTSSKTFTITQPTALITSTALTNVACNGGSNGVGAISASGGAGGYTYLWSNGAATSVITGLMAGVYTATVTDANNCKASKSVIITQPSALVTTTALTNVICNGGSNGSATITASGGAGGYSYLWSNGASTSAISGLLAGVYTATVTDANSCTSIKAVTITQPSALVTTTAFTNAACNGGTGSATITASGGTGAYTYLWNSGATTPAITGLAGVYTATVTDANSCTSTKSVTITQPSALVTTTAVTNVACNGGSNGVGAISASGGAGSYTYLWSNGATTSAITGLMAGVYTATVTDANNCKSTKSLIITQPSALVTTTAVTNIACNSGSNGSATITASGGAGGYSYLWSNGASTSAISGLLAGVYTATVTDANSCTSIKAVTITQPSALVTATAVTNAACNGGNGSATITASGGTGAYAYLWSSGATTSVISVLAGAYTATVTDANSCTSVKAITITQPAALVTSTAVTNIACNGGNNGSATITASGGTGAYTYLWSNGAATSAVSGLVAGVYTATVTDANNCTSIKAITITQPSALATTTAVTNVACNGGSTGSATITASGGTGAYAYLWSSGATTSVITGIAAGVYTITVTDANSCTSNKAITIAQPPALITTTALTNVACNGGSNGSATITASGGAGAYTYLWSNGATAAIINGVVAGVYTATVTDANNCKSTKTITVTQPSALVTATAVTNALCNGATGSATITATGGTGVYTYLWSSGATTSVISVLAGVYTATVTDANSCTGIKAVTITQPAALITTTAVTNIACNGGSTGGATITASGGTGAYTYLWSNGAATSFISGVMAGVYTATVTDANSCSDIKAITVTQPPVLITATAVANAACNGGTGSATVTASGGTGAYTYLWSTGATTSFISGVAAGVYTATVTDANSCTNTTSAIITEPSALTASTLVANILCNGGGTGSATITATGGTGTYAYLWSSGATASVITGITAGIYTATVTDANSCTSTVSAIVTEPSALVISSSVIDALCNGGTGSATITASGGTGAYTYLWSSGATTSVVTGIAAGAYFATVTDANSCTNIEPVTITEPSALIASSAVADVTCNGDSNGSATITASGGTGAYAYLWSTGATASVITGVTAGAYTATVTDANNCSSTYSITINQPAALDVTVTASSASVCAGDQATLAATAAGGTGAISYSWTSGPAGNVYVVNPAPGNNYTVEVTDANLCVKTQTYSINVAPLPTISVNNYTICSGSSATIVPTGADTYTITGGSFTVSPLSDTNYSITGTSLAGCLSATFAMASVSVAPLPTVAVSNTSICSGQTYTFVPVGNATTYSLNGSSTLTVSPLVTTDYTVEGTDANGCNLTSGIVITVSVNPSPTLSINSATICSGETATLVPAGATGGTYTITGGSYIVSPNITTSYTLTGTSNNFCPAANSAVAIVSVNITPTLSVNSPSICSGQTATLIPSGAAGGTYTITGGSFTVTPLTTDSYTITGTGPGNCPASNTVVALVSVDPLPVVAVTSGEICTGETFTISATGADTYSVNAVANVSSVSPTVTTSYSVTGASLAGCVSANAAILTVSVNPLPVITATASVSSICEGSGANVVLTGGTADTYTWSTGDNTATVSVSPSVTTIYVLQGTSNKGCVNSATVEITVDACTGIASQPNMAVGLAWVYPNPNNGEFVIEAVEPADLIIVTSTGKMIRSQPLTPGSTQLSMKEMANGIYFIKVRAGAKQASIKIIKQ